MLTRKTVILAKVETTYGTDSTPTPSANAILVKNVGVRPIGESVERDFYRASLSPLEFVRGMKEYELTFETELKGTGSAGAVPSWGWEGELLRACGMDETIQASVDIVYGPVSASFESVTIYVYKDGLFHKLLGCRGTFTINFPSVGQYATVRWTFRGMYATPTDASPGAQTFSSIKPPVFLSAGITIASYSPVATRMEIAMNNEIGRRTDANYSEGIKEFTITNRRPGGSFDPESVTEATHPFWADWAAANAKALNVGPLGSTAGNKITITAPKLQLDEISYGDREGTATYEIPFRLAQDSGDDELEIKFE
jgi:hypothetical protein